MKKLVLSITVIGFLAGCGAADLLSQALDDIENLSAEELANLPVDAEGDVAAQGAKKAIQDAIADVGRVNTGGGVAVPGAVSPQAAVFDTSGTDSTAAAPTFNAQAGNDNASLDISNWEGPLSGPDGKAGWHRRTYTYEKTNYDDKGVSSTTDVKSHYWFRSVPEHDFATWGWYSFKGSELAYAWTTDDESWNTEEGKSYWLMTIMFTQPQVLNGEVVPGLAKGTWDWKVQDEVESYGGSFAKGTYEYFIGSADHHLFYSDDFAQQVSDLADGDELTYDFAGISKSTYEGESKWSTFQGGVTRENSYKYFGGGENSIWFQGVITKVAGEKVDFVLDFGYNGKYYNGSGDKNAGTDYFARPEYSAETTPPGDLWREEAKPNFEFVDGELQDTGEPAKDGLAYWTTFESYSDWAGTNIDVGSDDDNQEGLTRVFLFRSETLTSRGGDAQKSVNCSSQDLADDCPDPAAAQQQ